MIIIHNAKGVKMKFLDRVKLIKDKKEYSEQGIYKGMIGTILEAEIRSGSFYVNFIDPKMIEDDIGLPIDIEDLELVENRNVSDEKILDCLPKNNPSWWCKVEDGYIMNLKGERKNKIPYNYNS